jgi:hypothetical protein
MRVIAACLAALSLAALGHAYEGADGGSHASHGHDSHPAHANHVALFGGATYHASHFYQTAGLDYERLLNPKLGVTGLAEVVFADHALFIAGAGLAWHPVSALKLAAIPALEHGDGHSAFLMRGLAEYAFHLGPLSVAPGMAVDYVSSEVALVPGIAVGAGF